MGNCIPRPLSVRRTVGVSVEGGTLEARDLHSPPLQQAGLHYEADGGTWDPSPQKRRRAGVQLGAEHTQPVQTSSSTSSTKK